MPEIDRNTAHRRYRVRLLAGRKRHEVLTVAADDLLIGAVNGNPEWIKTLRGKDGDFLFAAPYRGQSGTLYLRRGQRAWRCEIVEAPRLRLVHPRRRGLGPQVPELDKGPAPFLLSQKAQPRDPGVPEDEQAAPVRFVRVSDLTLQSLAALAAIGLEALSGERVDAVQQGGAR